MVFPREGPGTHPATGAKGCPVKGTSPSPGDTEQWSCIDPRAGSGLEEPAVSRARLGTPARAFLSQAQPRLMPEVRNPPCPYPCVLPSQPDTKSAAACLQRTQTPHLLFDTKKSQPWKESGSLQK